MSKDTQGLEANILQSIKQLSKETDTLIQVKICLMDTRSRLCNLIAIYQENRTIDEVDDLFLAIVKDQALTKDDLKMAFDYDEDDYRSAFERIRSRI